MDRLECYYCGWTGSENECSEDKVCPNCNKSGGLQTDG